MRMFQILWPQLNAGTVATIVGAVAVPSSSCRRDQDTKGEVQQFLSCYRQSGQYIYNL